MDIKFLRNQIDEVDNQILQTLSRRFKTAKKIGQLKVKNNLSVEDSDRETRLMEKIRDKSIEYKLSSDFTRRLFKLILDESKRLQKDGK